MWRNLVALFYFWYSGCAKSFYYWWIFFGYFHLIWRIFPKCSKNGVIFFVYNDDSLIYHRSPLAWRWKQFFSKVWQDGEKSRNYWETRELEDNNNDGKRVCFARCDKSEHYLARCHSHINLLHQFSTPFTNSQFQCLADYGWWKKIQNHKILVDWKT